MYCRYCGKQIEEDSIFCKYCGKNVTEREPTKSKDIATRSYVSKGKQIAVIVYGFWFLGWLYYLLAHIYTHFMMVYIMPFFLYTIVIPFFIVGCWSIYKIIGNKKNRSTMHPIINASSVETPQVHRPDNKKR